MLSDFDRDGDTDVAVSNHNAGTVQILFNRANCRQILPIILRSLQPGPHRDTRRSLNAATAT